MFTLRGLIGSLSAFLILLTLILCLSETRQRLGNSEWGIMVLSRSGNPWLHSVWLETLLYSLVAIPFGYLLANRLTSLHQLPVALLGACIVVVLYIIIPTPRSAQRTENERLLREGKNLPLVERDHLLDYQRASKNQNFIASFIFPLIGAALALELASRMPKRRYNRRLHRRSTG